MLSLLKRSISILILLVCVANPCYSQTNEQDFKRHLDKAIELYKTSHLAESIIEFEQAYRIKQIPNILYNLGQAHRKLGHGQEALRYFHLYEQTNPDLNAEERVMLRMHIEGAQALIKAIDPSAQPSASASVATAETAPTATPEAPEPPPAKGCPPPPACPPLPPPPPPFRLPRGFWIGIGTSAGLALTGIITGAVALAKAQDLRNLVDPLAADFSAQQSQLRALSATTDVLLVGAVVSFGVTVAATTLPPLLGRKRRGVVH